MITLELLPSEAMLLLKLCTGVARQRREEAARQHDPAMGELLDRHAGELEQLAHRLALVLAAAGPVETL